MKLATRKKSAKKQKQSVKFNVQWLILILASFLMIAFVYFKQGKIGNEISLALGGIFGFKKAEFFNAVEGAEKVPEVKF